MQLAHRHQHGPAAQLGRRLVDVGDLVEAVLAEQLDEVVLAEAAAGTAHRSGRLDHQRGPGRTGVRPVLAQHQAAGDAEDRRGGLLAGHRGRGRGERLVGLGAGLVDAGHRAEQLLLGDRDHLRGDAAGVGEGQHGGLLADEQHGRRRVEADVAGGAAGGAVVAVGSGGPGEQPIGLVVTDLGTYLVADVDQARHEDSLVCGSGGPGAGLPQP